MKRTIVGILAVLIAVCLLPASSFAADKGGLLDECIGYSSPVAGADTYVAEAGSPLDISVPEGVLNNDQSQQTPAEMLMAPSLVSSDGPYYTVYETQTSWVQINPNGSLVFSPPFWLSGTVNYYYQVADQNKPNCPGIGRLSFTVNQPNQAGLPIKLGIMESVINTLEGARGVNHDVTIHFKLSRPSTSLITFACNTTGESATSSYDYVRISRFVQIPAGATEASIPVTIRGDSTPEGNETFRLSISRQSGGTVIDGSDAKITIIDDE